MACQVCGKPCQAGSSFSCPGCLAVWYCSAKHLNMRGRLGHDAEQCQRMKQQLQRGPELFQHNMPWPAQGPEDVHNWLCQMDCHSQGLLQYCCPGPPCQLQYQQQQQQMQSATAVAPALCTTLGSLQGSPWWQTASLPCTQEQWQAAWGVTNSALLPAWRWQPGQQQPQPANWAEYYDYRGIDRNSPVALALHFPMTLWHCLVDILPSKGWALPPMGSTVTIIYLGPQIELFLLQGFMELALLLPEHHLDIHFVGPDVPDELHAKSCRAQISSTGGFCCSFWAGCWHDILEDWEHASTLTHATASDGQLADQQPAATASPGSAVAAQHLGSARIPSGRLHLVFAPNAGLPAFPSWLPTLQHLAGIAYQSAAGAASALDASAGSARFSEAAAAGSTDTMNAGKAGMTGDCGQQTSTPVVFSDYCEEAAFGSSHMVQQLFGASFSLKSVLNPFRNPAPAIAHGTRLPACSNGFFFGWV